MHTLRGKQRQKLSKVEDKNGLKLEKLGEPDKINKRKARRKGKEGLRCVLGWPLPLRAQLSLQLILSWGLCGFWRNLLPCWGSFTCSEDKPGMFPSFPSFLL